MNWLNFGGVGGGVIRLSTDAFPPFTPLPLPNHDSPSSPLPSLPHYSERELHYKYKERLYWAIQKSILIHNIHLIQYQMLNQSFIFSVYIFSFRTLFFIFKLWKLKTNEKQVKLNPTVNYSKYIHTFIQEYICLCRQRLKHKIHKSQDSSGVHERLMDALVSVVPYCKEGMSRPRPLLLLHQEAYTTQRKDRRRHRKAVFFTLKLTTECRHRKPRGHREHREACPFWYFLKVALSGIQEKCGNVWETRQ